MAGDALPRCAVVAAASLLIGACITLAVAPLLAVDFWTGDLSEDLEQVK